MNIAEKLQSLAENEQAISDGINAEADLIEEIKNIVNNLPEAGGNDDEFNVVIAEQAEIIEEIQDLVSALPSKADVFEEGKASAEKKNEVVLANCNEVLVTKGVEAADVLEQVPQRIGEITVTEDLMRLTSNPKFPGLGVFDKEEVVLNLDYADMIDRVIYAEWGYAHYPNTNVKHLTLNCAQKVLVTRQAFLATSCDTILERITFNADMSKSTNCLQMFVNLTALKVINGTPLDLTSSTNNGNMINSCNSLEEIRFAPNSIKVSIGLQGSAVLSDATIQSIIDGLAEVATAQTLTFHATVGAKLTDAQKATITAKNWTLVY